ncbi:hypothetical protein M2D07_014630 [Pseudomonas sp. BGr12]|uniref:hypothetical protein n=1 Tax=unclassified Pseudomonas TaxID=196821 RepID=UPI00111C77C2|nr:MULTISPECIES: hypothetical protein [unclassified Pseudomonas]MBD9500938.1 hypothetical protein [Pseudomonas sp. PDM17]MBD9515862.1 hypothetical protein [Pseudomonas sp. PDM22]MBD9579086.1 hypothetical protein [Pseudomonas sp. PDM23]MBD9629540.1 hypothetical protein [Pseudomonas sp. PDM19]MBD9672928.1 hypothetical protein [Pseudomonas sp. PDM21]
MERLRKVLMASAFNETCVVQVLREAALKAATPDTATALMAAALLLEHDAETLLHAAHRIDLVLHHAPAEGGTISLVVMD